MTFALPTGAFRQAMIEIQRVRVPTTPAGMQDQCRVLSPPTAPSCHCCERRLQGSPHYGLAIPSQARAVGHEWNLHWFGTGAHGPEVRSGGVIRREMSPIGNWGSSGEPQPSATK